MRKIAMFVENQAHYEFLKALLNRLSREYRVLVEVDWRNVRRGHGAVIRELRQFLRDLVKQKPESPDLVIVATDANCKSINERIRELDEETARTPARVVCAVPDPHIERWLLLDSAAFKQVFGRGCRAPDQKCERGRYKKQLMDAICDAGIIPNLGGIEYAEDIVNAMDLTQAVRGDNSLERLVSELRGVFQQWRR